MNKNRFLPAALCFIVSLCSHAQRDVIDRASFCCLYTHYVQTEDREHVAAVDSFYSILEVGDTIYKYGHFPLYARHKKYFPDELKGYAEENCMREEYLWVTQNYPRVGMMTVEDALHPAIYKYTESMDSLRWKLLPGDTTIMKYPCHKARLRYAGREWKAWYTEKIPVSSGPWKLAGLPGLVLFAQDKTGTHTFQANAIFKVEHQPINRVNSQSFTTKETKRDDFIKTRNRVKGDPRYMKHPYYHDEASVSMGMVHTETRKRLGFRPFLWINMIKYPCREKEDGKLEYIYNWFQPLELY